MSETYVKPELYLYLQYRVTGGSTKYVLVDIVKINDRDGWDRPMAVDGYDFSNNEYERKSTRYFEMWNPRLRYYDHDGTVINDFDPRYEDLNVGVRNIDNVQKTLKSLHRAFDKMKSERGNPSDVAETIMRYGEICKVSGVCLRNKDESYTWIRGDAVDMRSAIKQYFLDRGWHKLG